jgi:ergothioneine biosynthesis protein EgtC
MKLLFAHKSPMDPLQNAYTRKKMCRFLCYKGRDILLSRLLYEPKNSLIAQSFKAQEREEPLNGDGFGIGWYSPDISATPCPFTSITPAWSNRNLRNLSSHVRSSCFFAHVRAATKGMVVSEENCHPFYSDRFLWMHNGRVGGFKKIQRKLRDSLPDPIYHQIQGTTDSEHAFALFLNCLGDPGAVASLDQIVSALKETLNTLEVLKKEKGVREPSFCNFAVTDGDSMVVSRYVSDQSLDPESLYYTSGRKYTCEDGICQMVEAAYHEHSVIVASERLTHPEVDWIRVPKNHLVVVTSDLNVQVRALD